MGDVLNSMEPRDYQLRISAGLLDNPDSNYEIQMDVGAGKTETVITPIAYRMANEDDYSAMVIVPTQNLATQWKDRLKEYNVDKLGSIRKNKGTNDCSTFHQRTKTTDNHWDGGFNGYDADDRLDILQQEQARELQRQKRLSYNADVMVSTYHQVASDIENHDLPEDFLEFDEIIVDEATHFVSRNYLSDFDKDEAYPGGYRIDKRFEDLYEMTKDDTRYIGLTALPGKKLGHIMGLMDAELISPPHEEITLYTPDVDTEVRPVDGDKIEDALHQVNKGLGNRIERFQHTLLTELDHHTSRPQAQYQTINYVGHENDDVDAAARSVLSLQNRRTRLLEADTTLNGDLLPENYRSPKIDKLRELHHDWTSEHEQYLIFTNFRDTARNISEQLGEFTGLYTGEVNADTRDTALEDFKNGVLDGLVMTYDAGGEGLDLYTADHVVQMSPDITSSKRQSAVGRAKRGDGVREHILRYDAHHISAPPILDHQAIPTANVLHTWNTKKELRNFITDDSAPDTHFLNRHFD